jgi:hypothetical protein
MANVAALAWLGVTGEESALSLEEAVGVSALSKTDSSGNSTAGDAANVREWDDGRDGDGVLGAIGSNDFPELFELLGDFTNLERKEEGIVESATGAPSSS